MMQSADHRFRADWPELWWLNGPRPRTIRLQSEMSSILIIVSDVFLEHASQMPFIENDCVIEAVTAYGTNHPLDVWFLPGGSSST